MILTVSLFSISIACLTFDYYLILSRCLLITTFNYGNGLMQGFPKYTNPNQLESRNIVYPQFHNNYSFLKTSTHLQSLPLYQVIAFKNFPFCRNVSVFSALLLYFSIPVFFQSSLSFSVIMWAITVGFLAIYPKFITLVSKHPLISPFPRLTNTHFSRAFQSTLC